MRSLIRHRPHMDWGMTDVRDEINRIFGNLIGEADPEGRFWAPPVDIAEEDERITITAELPGIEKKDVRISIQENVLTLEGEKTRKVEEKDDRFCRCERSYGRFSRSFTLPSKVDADKISADFNDGILMVSLPKVAEAKPRQIEIR